MLRRHPLRCPAAFIGLGLYSQEMKQVGMDMTLRITHSAHHLVDGSHLFPMEQPHMTAARDRSKPVEPASGPSRTQQVLKKLYCAYKTLFSRCFVFENQ